MDDTATIMWAMLFGAIGVGFIMYGRKQRAAMPLLAGVALCLFPYFITNVYLLVITGAVLMALPYFVRI
ncbi:hypothetical protein MNBD_NITROSPINAE04-1792 [hydrothermal vent metagenome]|uniref:Uncharacterized protein n=2 Tax=hydrothermal vent metagenome TaxID=652676 RepID=A0A3B1C4W2_9ZZZZ